MIPLLRLGARWNRLVKTVKTRKKREKNGEKMGEIQPKRCEGRELTKDQLQTRGRRMAEENRAARRAVGVERAKAAQKKEQVRRIPASHVCPKSLLHRFFLAHERSL